MEHAVGDELAQNAAPTRTAWATPRRAETQRLRQGGGGVADRGERAPASTGARRPRRAWRRRWSDPPGPRRSRAARRPGAGPGATSSGSSVTASPRATSARLMIASLVRWRMSGSKPPSSRQVRSVISSQPISAWPAVHASPASSASGTASRWRRASRVAWRAGRGAPGPRSRSWRSTPAGQRAAAGAATRRPARGRRRRAPARAAHCSGSASTSSQRRPRRVARERLHRRQGEAQRDGLERGDARRGPVTVPAAAARSASASAARSSSASAWSTSTSAESVRRTPRPARSSSAHAGLALEHRELLRDGRGRELQRIGDGGDRPALRAARAAGAGGAGRAS